MIDSLDREIIKKLQGDMLLVSEPYRYIAEELGIDQEELLRRIERLNAEGVMRRFGATLHHRKAGVLANAMVVWKVPEERIEEVASIMVTFRQISHCYRRPVFKDWQYNIFTMIHGNSNEECEDTISKVSDKTSIKEFSILYSVRELKKTSMKYF